MSDDQAVMYCSVDENKSTVAVTLSAASQNGAQDIMLSIRNPKGKSIVVLSTQNENQKFFTENKEKEVIVKIPYMEAYETLSVFLE